jgi:hypothetical protein
MGERVADAVRAGGEPADMVTAALRDALITDMIAACGVALRGARSRRESRLNARTGRNPRRIIRRGGR